MIRSECRRLTNLPRMVASFMVSILSISFLFVGSFVLGVVNWNLSDLAGASVGLFVSFALIAVVLGLPVLFVAGLLLVLLHDAITKRLSLWCVISPLMAIIIYAPIDLIAFKSGAVAFADHFTQHATLVRFAYAAGVAALTAMIFFLWTARLHGRGSNPGI